MESTACVPERCWRTTDFWTVADARRRRRTRSLGCEPSAQARFHVKLLGAPVVCDAGGGSLSRRSVRGASQPATSIDGCKVSSSPHRVNGSVPCAWGSTQSVQPGCAVDSLDGDRSSSVGCEFVASYRSEELEVRRPRICGSLLAARPSGSASGRERALGFGGAIDIEFGLVGGSTERSAVCFGETISSPSTSGESPQKTRATSTRSR